MKENEKLFTGVAYHGNRILHHVREDMEDIVKHNMNLVVHMFSHNDWDRHFKVMKEVVSISEGLGLEVWLDNWGLAGNPGDKSHFLSYHPEAHQIYSDGSVDPVNACYNHPAFIQFSKDWVYAAREIGGKKLFWDEPHFNKKKNGAGEVVFSCCCDTCKKLFEERYGHLMPTERTDEVKEFHRYSFHRFFDAVTSYSASLGMENVSCVMVGDLEKYGTGILEVPTIDNFGIDPYWFPKERPGERDPFNWVYTQTKNIIEKTEAVGKKTHIWLQGYGIPAGDEDDIMLAADGAYEGGARTILAWSYRGGESHSYGGDNCERLWHVMGEAMGHIRTRHFDALREQRLAELMKK